MPASPPPLYTLLCELAGWTLDRTADIPKSHRFTVGQRLDSMSIDAMVLVVRALHVPKPRKAAHLEALNESLEVLRALWRLVHQRRWISAQQLVHVIGRIDEAGRMTGGWLRHLSPQPHAPARRVDPP
ncbi:MAG: four helix bundle protein [Verrucomicrobiota bacterium]